MKGDKSAVLDLLRAQRVLTPEEDCTVSDACRSVLLEYRRALLRGKPSHKLRVHARQALLHLGGDPVRSSRSLKHYDHKRYGPFLGVSDEGSAAGDIRDAAFESPKVQALPKTLARMPLTVGVAVDAERLGGVGEVAVGPEEYCDVWLEAIDRVLITTNIGTRVNLRVYRREPAVIIKSDTPKAVATAKSEIAAAFKPFIDTPDGCPRPLTVFIDFPRYASITPTRKRAILRQLVKYLSGRTDSEGRSITTPGQELGVAAWVSLGRPGRDQALETIDLAASAGIRVVILDGVKRKDADRAVSLAGLLEYFPPGLVGPILRHAAKRGVQVRAANLPDTTTMARSTWVGLTTARSYGANLGKYGCFPLTRSETDHVVEQVQGWLVDWSAAPVFFVDQGLLREGGVDVGHDLVRGLEYWLETVATHRVPIVLIDTIDKATGKRLVKKTPNDSLGFLGWKQIKKVEALARKLRIKVLWAGGLGLRDAYQMGKLGVFGIYVTSATASTIPVSGSYARDPSLAVLKEPSKDGVLRTKIILEAGFLATMLGKDGDGIEGLAGQLLDAHDRKDAAAVVKQTVNLTDACVNGWREYWKTLARQE